MSIILQGHLQISYSSSSSSSKVGISNISIWFAKEIVFEGFFGVAGEPCIGEWADVDSNIVLSSNTASGVSVIDTGLEGLLFFLFFDSSILLTVSLYNVIVLSRTILRPLK